MSRLPDFLRSTLVFVLSFQLVSCGTILYPERKGQKDGRLDVGVVLLDGIGLLFFLIPGVIAFAVDFSNGTIYLPPGKTALQTGDQNSRMVKFDKDHYTPALLEEMVRRETGQDFTFQDQRLEVTKLENSDDVPVYFARFQSASRSELSLLK